MSFIEQWDAAAVAMPWQHIVQVSALVGLGCGVLAFIVFGVLLKDDSKRISDIGTSLLSGACCAFLMLLVQSVFFGLSHTDDEDLQRKELATINIEENYSVTVERFRSGTWEDRGREVDVVTSDDVRYTYRAVLDRDRGKIRLIADGETAQAPPPGDLRKN